jgi:hypothetical protein
MAGSKSIEEIIGIAPLTAAIRVTSSGIPNPFPSQFSTVKPKNRVIGDRARYIRLKGVRTTAKMGVYGTAGRRVPLQPVESDTVRMLWVAMEFMIDVNMLNRLQAFLNGGPYQQDEGMDFLSYQLEEMGKRMANTRIAATASVLQYGAIYWDSDGNLLPSSSGASTTMSMGISANNQNQLNGIIASSWALSNTDIMLQLRTLKLQAAQDSGIMPEHAMIGLNIPTYFQQNVTLQPYLARHANFRDTLVDTNMVPPNFADIKSWTDVSRAFFEDQNGVNQKLWGADSITFTPDIMQPDRMDWYGMFEGSAAVLTSFDVAQDAMGALQNCKQEYGMSGWSLPTLQAPLGVTVFLQDCFLPAIRNEKAPYQAVVAF